MFVQHLHTYMFVHHLHTYMFGTSPTHIHVCTSPTHIHVWYITYTHTYLYITYTHTCLVHHLHTYMFGTSPTHIHVCTSPTHIHVAIHVTCSIICYSGYPFVVYITKLLLRPTLVCDFTQRTDVSDKKISVPFPKVKKSWTSCCVESQRAEISFTSQGSLRSRIVINYHEHN
jgi:hypothetical protein